MCLAIPMRITAVDGVLATVAVEGLEQVASLALLPEATVGDYVLVHAGYALTVLDADEAVERYALLREIGALDDDGGVLRPTVAGASAGDAGREGHDDAG